MKTGKVYLTGGGCGDTGLLTLKALEALRSCEAVIYDSLVPEALLGLTKADCEKIYVGKRYGSHAMKQSEINALLAQKAREGKTVVRLKGGDPYVFGRGGEEFLALREAGICCEEIPGISSAVAVPAAAGIPVTHRGLSASVTVVTGTAAEEGGQAGLKMDFDVLARLDGTLVVLMGMHHLQEIADGLMAAGKSPDTPCAVVMEGTTERQRCMRTVLSRLQAEVSSQGFTAPAVIVIGAVAALELVSEKVGETKRMPEEPGGEMLEKATGEMSAEILAVDSAATAGQMANMTQSRKKITVGVTGTPHFVEKVSAALNAMNMQMCTRYSGEGNKETPACAESGGEAYRNVTPEDICADIRGKCTIETWDMGFMEIRPDENPLPDLEDCGWLVFTSPNGAEIFLDKIKRERRDLRTLHGKRIAAIGPGTAAVFEETGIYVDYIPEVYDVTHLAEGLTRQILAERQAVSAAEQMQDDAGVPVLQCVDGEAVMTMFLRAKQGSGQLPRIFKGKEIPFTEYPLYELGIREEKRAAVITKEPDYIVFGSAMGVQAYFEGMEQAGLTNTKSRYVCIGELCGEELKKHTDGYFLTAQESSVEAIVKCLCEDIAAAVS